MIRGKILVGLVIIGILMAPSVHSLKIEEHSGFSSAPSRWHDKGLHTGLWSVAKYANDDRELNIVISGKTVYEWLNILFDNCESMESFFERVESICGDALDPHEGNILCELPLSDRKLSKIVEKILTDNDRPTYLCCHHQVILLASAIKARFSHPYGSIYVLKSEYQDFLFYFNMGQEERVTMHVQMVVDKWNGDDTPNDVDKWEIDTWEDQYRVWEANHGWKYNSQMWTSDSTSGKMLTPIFALSKHPLQYPRLILIFILYFHYFLPDSQISLNKQHPYFFGF